MDHLTGSTAIITGGTRGIGYAIAEALLARGVRVVINGQSETSVDRALAALNHDAAYGFAGDVSDEAAVTELFDFALGVLGSVDILVNNAGIAVSGPTVDLDLETFQRVIDINLTGTFLCAREAFRIMAEQGSGRIVNIGSIAAQRPRTGALPYAVSKFGVQGLTRALALEGRELGIMVSCLHPGNVDTDIWGDQSHSEPRMAPADVARVVVAMLDLPADVNLLDAIVLDQTQPYLARG